MENLNNELIETFKAISIRGRMAFAINCLDNIIETKGIASNILNKFILNLWQFTRSNNLGEWDKNISDFIPMIGEELEEEELDYLTIEEGKKLQEIYSSLPKFIVEVIDNIIDLGRIELFTSHSDYAPKSLKRLEKIITIVINENIPLPDVNEYKKFHYNIDGGWGKIIIKNLDI